MPIRAELHCHTYRSKDSLLLPHQLLEVCRKRNIDRLAITDHNTIAGALEARALDPERVIVGEEIMTTEGELLAYYLAEEIPAGLKPTEALRRLRAQGAVISVSHPFDRMRGGSWEEAALEAIAGEVDAIEVFNARAWSAEANRAAQRFATRHGLTGTAGSDAHAAPEVGRVVMLLQAFDGADGFREALKRAQIVGRRSSPFVHFYSRYAVWRKRMGWGPRG